MAKIRVYELARELNMSNKQLVEKLKAGGMSLKNHMSTLDEEAVIRARDIVSDVVSNVVEERQIRPKVIRRRRHWIKILRKFEGHTNCVYGVCFSPDTRFLASGSWDHTVRLWEVETGRQLRVVEGHEDYVHHVCFSPDGRWIASASDDNTARLWDAKTGREIRVFRHTGAWGVSFSPDGQFLSTTSSDHDVRLWEVATGRKLRVLKGHKKYVCMAPFSPCGRFLASASDDNTIRLWEVESGRQIRVMENPSWSASVCFSPDGRFLGTGSGDNNARIWEVETGREYALLKGHSDPVIGVSFSPDSRFFASGSRDNTIRLWDVETGRQLHVLRGHNDELKTVSFSPDGRYLASASCDKTIRLWDTTPLNAGPKARPKPVQVPRAVIGIGLQPLMKAHVLTLPLSHATPPTPSRPATWLRSAGSVGISAPLFLVQDLGTLLTQSRDRLHVGRPGHLPGDVDTSAYLAFLTRLAGHPVPREASVWDISDAIAGVVIARLLSGIAFPEQYATPTGAEAVKFGRQLGIQLDRIDVADLWRRTDPGDRPVLAGLLPPETVARIESNLRKLDINELRFLHTYGPRYAGAPDPREMLDLFTLLDLPPVVRKAMSQVLRLLPRVSEAVSTGGIQTYAMGGYDGLTRKGNMDSLMPTEAAYPDELFVHRIINHEALYYGREGEREIQRELAFIVTQAGVDMLGDLAVLSQGVTMALAQTMHRRGYEVQQSFIGAECTPPDSMTRPADIQRVLYYKDKRSPRPKEMLDAVSRQLRLWKEQYRGMQVLWVLGEHWDEDEMESHGDIYEALKQHAGQQAWFLRSGDAEPILKRSSPAAARHFHRFHVLDSGALWH